MIFSMYNRIKQHCLSAFFLLSLLYSFHAFATPAEQQVGEPRIVNIVNFIRLLEPRDAAITEDVLYQTVVKQVEIMNKYQLKGTFLLQYDALMDGRYQQLLRSLPKDQYEIGGWWEIPQPLVEKAGLKWRGRYPWDWHADVGFSTGYTQEERRKLVDVYMEDFKAIFGYYPRSVGSWFIDAYSINYMYERYHIVASSNCKDQYGTDGYTLWGGYWNQAYYPSKINAYMPAQHASAQIPVPVFRMLGSDPVRQYDYSLGSERQGVVTLEPVYEFGGGDSAWVHWFFGQFVEGERLAFAYTQAGQENSFTWNGMAKGFEIQMPLIARLRDENKITVQTLEESGKWFSKNYPVTPATAVTVNKDIGNSDLKTVWYNSRFYRTNLIWEHNNLRIRDIHLFDERFPSVYETEKATSNECKFFTLPFVDGYLWSNKDSLAGMRFKANINGKAILLSGTDPEIKETGTSQLQASWPLTTIPGKVVIDLNETTFTVSLISDAKTDWYIELETTANADLPFNAIQPNKITNRFDGFHYSVEAISGTFVKAPRPAMFIIKPTNNKIVLKLDSSK